MSKITTVVDNREHKLIGELHQQFNQMSFNVEQLEIGDIVYKYNNDIVAVIERKTLDDYCASIADGRLHNQSIRIGQLINTIVIYLVEGVCNSKEYKFRGNITYDSLCSSFVNRIIKDKFVVYRTQNIQETAHFVHKMSDKLEEYYSTNQVINSGDVQQVNSQVDYLKTIKTSKKDNMTPHNCYLCQLAQIPGVSIEIANAISRVHIKMSSLISHLEKNGNMSLKNLELSLSTGKTRKLGPVLSERIYTYLCGETYLDKNTCTSEENNMTEPVHQKVKLNLKVKVKNEKSKLTTCLL